jgi:hypothetical protein
VSDYLGPCQSQIHTSCPHTLHPFAKYMLARALNTNMLRRATASTLNPLCSWVAPAWQLQQHALVHSAQAASQLPQMHGTTVLCIKKDGQVCPAALLNQAHHTHCSMARLGCERPVCNKKCSASPEC